MRVKDLTPTKHSRIVSTLNIPVGTVFRGTIVGKTRNVTGVFYKTASGTRLSNALEASGRIDLVIVQLNQHDGKLSNVRFNPQTVLDYEVLDVELVIKGVL